MKKNAHLYEVGDRVRWHCGERQEQGVVTRVVLANCQYSPYLVAGDLLVRGVGEDFAVAVHSSLVSPVD